MNALDLIAAHLARPVTHRVTTAYEGGAVRTHDVRSLAQAQNWATGERRKVGRTLLSRETGESVKVIAVTINAI